MENQKKFNRKREQYYPNFNCLVKSIKTSFKQSVKDGFEFEGEQHHSWELVFVISGSVFVSEDGIVYKLNQGDIIFHKPMEFHKIWCKQVPKAKFQVMSFVADSDLLNPLGDRIINLNLEKKTELENIFQSIEKNFDNSIYVFQKETTPDEVAERITFARLELFLLSLLGSTKIEVDEQYSVSAMNYKRIIEVMEENLSKNLTIEDLASLCNLSVSNLKRIFAKFSDMGVIKYFTRMKIKNAIQRLRCGDSVATVSHELGFSSQNYFSVVFKRETGILPSKFIKTDLPNW